MVSRKLFDTTNSVEFPALGVIFMYRGPHYRACLNFRLAVQVAGVMLALAAAGCSGGGGGKGGPGPTPTYSIGGTITGLTAGGLVLANGTDTVSPAAGAMTFTFATPLAFGVAYSVTAKGQPAGISCAVSAGTGSVGSVNVTTVQVVCGSNTIAGTIDGLIGTGLKLTNGQETLSPTSPTKTFSFQTIPNFGDSYSVAVTAQPVGQICEVTNGAGTVGKGPIAVVVACAGQYWTWLGGSKISNATGVLGTQGTPGPLNIPGARAGSVTWSGSGGLWLFGGYGNAGAGPDTGMSTGYLSDLWKYDSAKGLWTWMNGSNASNHVGMYSNPKGSAGGSPGGRNYAVSWTDSAGAVWLFGGAGCDSSVCSVNANTVDLNDLWKYDPKSNGWTWMSGSASGNAPGTYGTLGVSATGNSPGAREGASSWYDSASGLLWLFGGYGYDKTGSTNKLIELNDLWSFDPKSSQWTWVAGSDTGGASGIYPATSTPSGYPGARRFASAWVSAGMFWLFGGSGYGANGTAAPNDLWRFDPKALPGSQWTFVSGSTMGPVAGNYGSLKMGTNTTFPGSRDQAVAWTDSLGSIWIFGGDGYDSTGIGSGSLGSLNDLWRYDASTNVWTWVSGSNMINAPGQYGVLGVANASNSPGGRQLASAWVDSSTNTLWLFGGYGYDSLTGTSAGLHLLNDLWFIVPK